jgi:hypothetical protein
MTPLTCGIYSFYDDNVPPDVVLAQSQVFRHLDLPLVQRYLAGRSHGRAMEETAHDATEDGVIFFDIDCIPLNRGAVTHWYLPAIVAGTLIGPAQRANHLRTRHVYAGPCALGFSRALYRRAGKPTMDVTRRADAAGELTYACEDRGIPVIKLPVTDCIELKWKLFEEDRPGFGMGTTWADSVFHAFEMRGGETRQMFLDKCDEVLQSSPVPLVTRGFPISNAAIHQSSTRLALTPSRADYSQFEQSGK